ncbi:MAG: hypothetical protein ACODAJ_00755, partial [Planctomycetota bacterium]
VSQGKLRAFRDENTLKFRRSDVDKLRQERSTEATVVLSPDDVAGGETKTDAQPEEGETEVEGTPALSEEPIDLLADEVLDYDDTAETIIGGESEAAEADMELDEETVAEEPESPTKVPTIELTPAAESTGETEETAVPTLELGEDAETEEPGSETEVPTMVLGLDEYDDTQIATEEVATEEVFLEEGELEEVPGTADVEEPVVEPEAEEEAERAIGSITGSSSYGTGEPLAVREAPSALYTVKCALAGLMLMIPGGIFFYCLATQRVPEWGFVESIMKFVWEQFGLAPPPV